MCFWDIPWHSPVYGCYAIASSLAKQGWPWLQWLLTLDQDVEAILIYRGTECRSHAGGQMVVVMGNLVAGESKSAECHLISRLKLYIHTLF